MKKILIVLLVLFMLSGCDFGSIIGKNKTYNCVRTYKDVGTQTIAKYSIELNSKNEPVKYIVEAGYQYQEGKNDQFEEACKTLKEALNDVTLEKYKDVATLEVFCEPKELKAYVIKTYDVQGIKQYDDFVNINNSINKYVGKDGKFYLEDWKQHFNESSYKDKYECDF